MPELTEENRPDAERLVFTVLITNVATGETRRTEHYYPLDVARDDVVFHWTEGNYGCDCNRELFFARAGGEPEPDTECTEDRFTAEVLPT